MSRQASRWIGVSLVLALASIARGQAMVEYVPDDAVVYVGWEGVAALGKSYTDSHLGALVHDAGLAVMVSDMVHAVGAAVDRHNPELRDVYDPFEDLSPALWRSRWALFVRQLPGQDPLAVELRVFVQPADEQDKALVAKVFDRIVKQDRQNFRTDTVDGLLTLSMIDHADKAPPLEGKPAKSLAGSQRLKAGLAHTPGPPAIVMHVNVKRIVDQALHSVEAQSKPAPETNAAHVPTADDYLRATGLDRVLAFNYAGGFAGRDWYSQTLVQIPVPRRGLASLLDGPGVTEADLAAVPDTAVAVTAWRLDLSVLLAQVRRIVAVGGKGMTEDFDQGVAAASDELGVDLEKDLLANLGSSWVVYSDPGIAIAGLGTGFCLVNPLKDPAKAQKIVEKITDNFNANLGGGNAGQHIHVQEQHGVKCYSLGADWVSLAWAIADGRLVVSSSPQAVFWAVEAGRQQNKLLTKTDKYQTAIQRLGGHNPIVLRYMDLPASAQQMYQTCEMGLNMASTFMVAQGLPPTALALPALEKITPHLAPAGVMAWADETGLRTLEISPFPGSTYLSPHGVASPTTAAVLAAAYLFNFMQAHPSPRDLVMNEARAIAGGQLGYAGDNHGRLPDDIAALLRGKYIAPSQLVTAASGKTLPDSFQAMMPEQQDQWIRQNASFILIPGLKQDDADAQKVAIFVLPGDSGSPDATAVTYTDGHTQWLSVDDARALIQKQTGKSLEDLTARQAGYTPPAAQPSVEPAPATPQ